MSTLFPYDTSKLLTGRHRILYAPTTVDVPTRISDVIDVTTPYAPKTGWLDVGATSAAADYSSAIAKNSLNIQQTTEDVKEQVQTVTRTFAFTAAETSPLIRQLVEESPGIVTLTAAANKSAEKSIPFGTINDLSRYRLAILTMFSKNDRPVTEPGGTIRGAWAGVIAYQVELDAQTYSTSFGESEIVAVPITVKAFPDPTVTTEGEEFGMFLEEQSGTISAS